MNNLGNLHNMGMNERVDSALRRFYQAEMPSTWPALRLPEEAPRRRSLVQRLTQNAGRMAIAASIVALVIGYTALTAVFPRNRSGLSLTQPVEPIGLHGSKLEHPTPRDTP
jgi:hypothetical protein